MTNSALKNLIKLRRLLHSEPELSGSEKNTSQTILSFISNFKPDQIIKNIGGKGIAFIFEGINPGPTILFRAELDALPIQELNLFRYKSKLANVSHKCGHDGHMTILAGLAQQLRKITFRGKVVLLFQPAEETGEGAYKILLDKKFQKIKPDYVFALHNLPGYTENSIVVRKNHFAATSKGMIIKLIGKTSHAGEPEKGINPSNSVAELIAKFSTLVNDLKELKNFTLITVIYVRVGERAFGTSPGYAEVMVTFRSYEQDDMKLMNQETEKFVNEIAKRNKLTFEISYTEEFPATINDPECVNLVANAARSNGYPVKYIRKPFRWTEDFGHFTNNFKGAMFGLGAGIYHPKLHNPDYDFPDKLIITGIKMFSSIIDQFNNK